MHLLPENYLVDGKQVVPGVTIVEPSDGKYILYYNSVFILTSFRSSYNLSKVQHGIWILQKKKKKSLIF